MGNMSTEFIIFTDVDIQTTRVLGCLCKLILLPFFFLSCPQLLICVIQHLLPFITVNLSNRQSDSLQFIYHFQCSYGRSKIEMLYKY